MAGIQQQAVQGTLPIIYIAKIEKFRKKGFDIFESIQKADEEIRKEQAAAAPPPEEGQVMAPEEAMGLAGPPQAIPPEAMAAGGATPQQGQVAQPPSNALEAASAYQPNVMPMNAPDDQPDMDVTAGLMRNSMRPEEIESRRNQIVEAELVSRMAAVSGDPYLINAAERQRAISRAL